MRRIDLINSVQKLGAALTNSGMIRATSASPATKEKLDLEELLTSFQEYEKYQNTYSDIDKKVLEIFGLSEIGNPKFWSKIIANSENDKINLPKIRMSMRYFLEFLPNILKLLKQDNINYTQTENEGLVENTSFLNQNILTVILPEEKNEISHPERLIKVLESINLFYKSFAVILNENNSDLSVAAIDSGSDKSFDFLGAAKLMEGIKELIIGLWDRIVFFREKQLSERLDLIAKSLPIMERISQLEQNETLSPEQAEILKRNITTATNNFISAGALIPEFDNYSINNPRRLMAAEPKLLTNSQSTSTDHPGVKKQDFPLKDDNFSEEDIAAIKELLNRKKSEE